MTDYYHCNLIIDGDEGPGNYLNDLDEKNLKHDILIPFVEQRQFIFDGYMVAPDKVKRLKVVKTSYQAKHYIDRHYHNMKQSGIDDMATIPKSIPVANGEDVTTALLSQTRQQLKIQDEGCVMAEEIDKYAPVKEKTLTIPGVGHFELIKPLIGYKKEIEKQISKYPYHENVFLMMKFRESNKELGDFIIENLDAHGLRGVRADQDLWNITRNVYNPIAVLYCCKYGIALFDEPEKQQSYSPNVAYELGIMHYQNKDCLILKHSSLPQVPFDLIKDLHSEYQKDLQVKKIIKSWISQVVDN